MAEAETDTVWLKCAYRVFAREKGRQKAHHVVSDPVPVRFKIAQAGDCPVVGRVVTDATLGPGYNVDYRMVEGVLMRPFLGPDFTPLRLSDVPRLMAGDRNQAEKWLDFPAPPVDVGYKRAAAIRMPDRQEWGLKDFEEDGQHAAVAAFGAFAERLRAIDGVLWRPTVPPCWELSSGGRWYVRATVPDFDFPDLVDRYAPAHHAMELPHALVEAHVDPHALAAALVRPPLGPFDDPGNPDVIVGAIAGDFPRRDLGLDNLWLARQHGGRALFSAEWKGIPPARKLTYATFEACADALLEGGHDAEVAARFDDAVERMATDPGYPRDVDVTPLQFWVPEAMRTVALDFQASIVGHDLAADLDAARELQDLEIDEAGGLRM